MKRESQHTRFAQQATFLKCGHHDLCSPSSCVFRRRPFVCVTMSLYARSSSSPVSSDVLWERALSALPDLLLAALRAAELNDPWVLPKGDCGRSDGVLGRDAWKWRPLAQFCRRAGTQGLITLSLNVHHSPNNSGLDRLETPRWPFQDSNPNRFAKSNTGLQVQTSTGHIAALRSL